MGINWDEFKAREGDFPERFKFETAGATITGTLTEARAATMPGGERLPALTLRDDQGVEHSVLASQTQLQRLLAEAAPGIGDRLTIAHTGIEQLSGGRTLKRFEVKVERAKTAGVNAADI